MNEVAKVTKWARTPVRAEFKVEIKFADWARMGRDLAQTGNAVNWWIGDWINFGLEKFCRRGANGKFVATEAYKVALLATGLEKESLRNMAFVAASVTADRRFEELTWSHHREVAGLKAREQVRWLKKALGDEGKVWSVSELRVAIREEGALVADGDEQEIRALPWVKPAADLLRFLKQEEADEPIENMEREKIEAMRIALKDVKLYLDRLWATPR